MAFKLRRKRLPDGGHEVRIALRGGQTRKEGVTRRKPGPKRKRDKDPFA